MASEEELSKTIMHCDFEIDLLNKWEEEVVAYIHQLRNKAKATRRKAIERLEAIEKGSQ